MKLSAVAIGLAVICTACSSSTPWGDTTSTSPPAAPSALPSAAHRWYPMGVAAVPIPADCSAECSLDCDVWSGKIRCGGSVGLVQVYGGLTSMAGMQLDQKGAHALGHQSLSGAITLRWGTTVDAQFCADVTREHWNWELCAPDDASRRQAILGVIRGYTQSFPVGQEIACANTGC